MPAPAMEPAHATLLGPADGGAAAPSPGASPSTATLAAAAPMQMEVTPRLFPKVSMPKSNPKLRSMMDEEGQLTTEMQGRFTIPCKEHPWPGHCASEPRRSDRVQPPVEAELKAKAELAVQAALDNDNPKAALVTLLLAHPEPEPKTDAERLAATLATATGIIKDSYTTHGHNSGSTPVSEECAELVDTMCREISEMINALPEAREEVESAEYSEYNHRMCALKCICAHVLKPNEATLFRGNNYFELCGFLIGFPCNRKGEPPKRFTLRVRQTGRERGHLLPTAKPALKNLAIFLAYCATGITDAAHCLLVQELQLRVGNGEEAPDTREKVWEDAIVFLVSRVLSELVKDYTLVDKGAYETYMEDMAQIIANMQMRGFMSHRQYAKLLGEIHRMPTRSKWILGHLAGTLDPSPGRLYCPMHSQLLICTTSSSHWFHSARHENFR